MSCDTLNSITFSECDSLRETEELGLGICEVCSRHSARYCCPTSEVKTCSVKCNRTHKLEVHSIGDMTHSYHAPKNLNLSSSFWLLGQISRVASTPLKGITSFRNGLSDRFFLLQQQALERQTYLKFLPKTFERHKNNTSRFNFGKQVIEWHMDFIFVNSGNYKISEERIPENIPISAVIKFLMSEENPYLQYYQAAELSGIRILLKAEQKRDKFYELDATSTIQHCLEKKIIIEYPTIYLALKDLDVFYDTDVVPDDEERFKNEIKQELLTFFFTL